MRPSQLGALVLALALSGCSGLVRQHYWSAAAEGRGVVRGSEPWLLRAPTYTLSPYELPVDVRVSGMDHAHYDVLMGPAVFWIVPLFLFAWSWYEPLPDDVLRLELVATGPADRLALRPGAMVLQLPDGRRLVPAVTDVLDGATRAVGYQWRQDWTERRCLLEYALPPGVPDAMTLRLDGVLIDGHPAPLPPLTVSRDADWKVWAPG